MILLVNLSLCPNWNHDLANRMLEKMRNSKFTSSREKEKMRNSRFTSSKEGKNAPAIRREHRSNLKKERAS